MGDHTNFGFPIKSYDFYGKMFTSDPMSNMIPVDARNRLQVT
jgi:hypothetical protein